jgi:hypothetical protein
MRALPFLQCRTVPPEFLIQYECSDRLLVAKNIQESHNLHNIPCLLRIQNELDVYVVGTAYGFHEEDDIIYMPMWMIHILKTTHCLSIASVPTHACTTLSIRPHNSGLFEIDDWHTKLRNGLRLYSTLTKGNMIAMQIDGLVYFTVEMLHPNIYDTVYLIGSGEMEVDIRHSFELEYTMLKQARRIAFLNDLIPNKIENLPNLPKNTLVDYSDIPYLVGVPTNLRRHSLYDTLKAFSGTAYSIRAGTDSLLPDGPGEAARRRMRI